MSGSSGSLATTDETALERRLTICSGFMNKTLLPSSLHSFHTMATLCLHDSCRLFHEKHFQLPSRSSYPTSNPRRALHGRLLQSHSLRTPTSSIFSPAMFLQPSPEIMRITLLFHSTLPSQLRHSIACARPQHTGSTQRTSSQR